MRAHGVDMAVDTVRWFVHCGKRVAVILLDHNYIHRTDRATVEALLAGTAGADYSIAEAPHARASRSRSRSRREAA